MKGSIDVGGKIKLRPLDGRSHPGTGSEMKDCLRPFGRESLQHGVFVSNIDGMEADIGENHLQILPFDLGIVEVVEIIDD